MGKPRKENGRERIIIARLLRFSDLEQALKCGLKLKDTGYKMYEDLPKEIQKNSRKDGERAYFSRSVPDKLYINGKYVKCKMW